MDRTSFETLFREIFSRNGLQTYATESNIEQFFRFTKLLLEANEHVNLTAIREIPDVIAKHFADCLLAAEYFPENATVLDIGCGGGFPTIPLAIARPDLKITALDSTQKKIHVVEVAAEALGLHQVHPLCARAEDAASGDLRTRFDIVTSRAMARMRILCELALPFLKIGGQMVVLKGAQGTEELHEASRAIQTLGGKALNDLPMALHCASGSENRHILIVSKKKPTPPQYPRTYAAILKKPL